VLKFTEKAEKGSKMKKMEAGLVVENNSGIPPEKMWSEERIQNFKAESELAECLELDINGSLFLDEQLSQVFNPEKEKSEQMAVKLKLSYFSAFALESMALWSKLTQTPILALTLRKSAITCAQVQLIVQTQSIALPLKLLDLSANPLKLRGFLALVQRENNYL